MPQLPVLDSKAFEVLRSAKILLQNGATLRNTLRMLNRQTPSLGNAVQSSETMHNSLGVNYKSAALDSRAYAEQSMSRETPCVGAMSR